MNILCLQKNKMDAFMNVLKMGYLNRYDTKHDPSQIICCDFCKKGPILISVRHDDMDICMLCLQEISKRDLKMKKHCNANKIGPKLIEKICLNISEKHIDNIKAKIDSMLQFAIFNCVYIDSSIDTNHDEQEHVCCDKCGQGLSILFYCKFKEKKYGNINLCPKCLNDMTEKNFLST